MVAGNHKPVLRNVYRAMRRRMNCDPFTVESRSGSGLVETLENKARRARHLVWASRFTIGSNAGMAPPAAVHEATKSTYPERTVSLFGSTSGCSQSVFPSTHDGSLFLCCNGASAQVSQQGYD